MKRVNFALLASIAFGFVCLACLVGLIFLGLFFNMGPFSIESQAEVLIQLQGGTHVVLEADLPPNVSVPRDAMQTTEDNVRARLNWLRTYAVVKSRDDRHLVIDFLGQISTREEVGSVIHVGLLEFVDLGKSPIDVGSIISTTGVTADNSCLDITAEPNQHSIIPAPSPTSPSNNSPVYSTIITGSCLSFASEGFSETNKPFIQFSLKSTGTKLLVNHTSANIGKYLAIVVDKKIVASPLIKSAITAGNGIIEAPFTQPEALDLVSQLRFGALPFPLRIIEMTSIGK